MPEMAAFDFKDSMRRFFDLKTRASHQIM